MTQILMNEDGFEQYLIAKGHTKKSTASMIRATAYFIRWTNSEQLSDLSAVTHNDMMAYVSYLNSRGTSKKTIANYLIHIRKYFDFLQATEDYPDNPCSHIQIRGIKRKILHEILTEPELEELHQHFRTEIHITHPIYSPPQKLNELSRKRNKVIVGLLIYQGIRSCELQHMTLDDVKFREGKVHIRGARRINKRTLKLESHQVYELLDYINDTRRQLLNYHHRDTDQLFVTQDNGKQFSNLCYYVRRQLQEMNPKIKCLEQIRTSVITHWLSKYNLRRVQYMAGHRYVSSTEKYKANNLDELKESIKQFHPL